VKARHSSGVDNQPHSPLPYLAIMNEHFLVKPFADLLPAELYAALQLRNEVFVVEQQCIFQDADNKDPHCHHLLMYQQDKLVAYARIVPPGLSYPEMSIGRVVTSAAVRGTGAGKKLMREAIAHCYRLYGNKPIRIGAQLYARAFYESLGFVQDSEVYDEDGIAHIEMIKSLQT